MKQRSRIAGVIALALCAVSCGGGGVEQGARPGSSEWYWEATLENCGLGDFAKAAGHLEELVKEEGPLQERAIVFRTAVLAGLARGHMEIGDAYRTAIKEEPKRAADYQNPIQQANRDGRQFAIALAESLGKVDKAMAGDTVTLDFPFPSGAAAESALATSIASGAVVPPEKHAGASADLLRRNQILAVTELAGKGDDAAGAKAAFEAGPVQVAKADARMAMAKMMLDVSVLFDRERVNQPDIRKIFIERAQQWSQPFLESDNADLKKLAEEFQKEIEDEQRDVDRKARRLKIRG